MNALVLALEVIARGKIRSCRSSECSVRWDKNNAKSDEAIKSDRGKQGNIWKSIPGIT